MGVGMWGRLSLLKILFAIEIKADNDYTMIRIYFYAKEFPHENHLRPSRTPKLY